MKIRPATEGDLPAIMALHSSSIRTLCASHYSPAHIAQWLSALVPAAYAALLDSRELRVATALDQLVGFGVLDGKSALINAMYVAPSSVRRGVGRALLGHMEARARALGVTSLRLHATLNAVSFYAAHGFVRVADATNQLPSGAELPCVVMRKAL